MIDKLKKHPDYSVPNGFLLVEDRQHGAVTALNLPVSFQDSSTYGKPIDRDRKVDGKLHMVGMHYGGKYRFGDGTVTAPAIAFAGSPKTGAYRSAANVLSVASNGVQKFAVNTTGGLAPSGFVTTPGTPTILSANQNDYDFTGSADPLLVIQRLSSDASRNITGFLARDGGLNHWLFNVGAQNIVLQNQNAGSSVNNRIITGTGADYTLSADTGVFMWYDTTTLKWRLGPLLYTAAGGSNHNFLSATHPDTVVGSPVRGDTVIANATPAWTKLAIGTVGKVLTTDGTDASWQPVPTQTSTLLDGSVHTDTLVGVPVLGDMIHANATPKWAKLAGNITSTKKFLNQTGTGAISAVPSWNALVTADIPTHALLDGVTVSDSIAVTVAKGTLPVGNATPKWDGLLVGGTDGQVLTVKAASSVGMNWQDLPSSFPYDPGTITVADLNYKVMAAHLVLTSTERLTLSGNARLAIV